MVQGNQGGSLPEGTDSIIAGAAGSSSEEALIVKDSGRGTPGGSSGGGTGAESGTSGAAGTGTGVRSKAVESLRTGGEKLSGQAADKARGFVGQGLERSSEALANVSKLVGDTAAGIDERLGPQYGDYARRAATAIEDTANRLAAKDADELIDDTREFVRKSPGIALTGAAVLGFALVRLVKSGLDQPRNDQRGSRGGSDNA